MEVEVAFYTSIPKQLLSNNDLLRIKKDLTSRSKDYMTDEVVTVEYFFEDPARNTIQVPRFYPLPHLNCKDHTVEGASLSDTWKLNDSFQFRDGQDKSVNDALSSNIITLMKPPGSGKTIIGSVVIAKRNVRSVIIVDQDNLKQQWLAALKLIFGDTIKVASDLKLDCSDKDLGYDVYVTTIQSIIAKIRIKGLEEVRDNYAKYEIGHVLLDECHVLIGPEKFSLFGHICNSRYILALSATPKNDVYFQYWLGDIVVGDNNYEVTPYVYRGDFNTDLGKSRRYIMWANKFRKDRYSQKLFSKEEYLNYICSLAYKAYLKDRHVLVICDYNKYGVDLVIEYLKRYIPDDKVGRYVSGCDKPVMSVRPIIVSNYKMLQKGTDIPTLDTLIMADSVGNTTALEQTIGRLLRLNKGIKKKELLVFDIHDSDFGDLFLRRKKIRDDFYLEKEFHLV